MKSRICKITVLLIVLNSSYLICQQKSIKRGMAYGNHSSSDLKVLSEGVSWWYNWYHQPESQVLNVHESMEVDFVPMAWNGAFDKEAMHTYLAGHPGVKYILGWNEPNFLSQANMKPSDAAAKWSDIEELADEFDLEIVSPAVNYCGDCVSENGTTYNDPVKYLDDFFEACDGCRVDHIAIHSYMGNVSALQWFVGLFKKYGKPIWLTEFANWENNPTLQDQKGFMIGAVDYLENDPDVFRYAWFTGRHTGPPHIGVLEGQGTLTELGEIYVNMPLHDNSHYQLLPALIEAEEYNAMFGILLEATADESGFANVGYIEQNDWLEYGIEVLETDAFDFSLRIASTTAASLQISIDNVALKTISLPNTNGWQNWLTVHDKFEISEGKHKLKIRALSGGFNINWFELDNKVVMGAEYVTSEKSFGYPNPARDKIFFPKEMKIIKATIVDVAGRETEAQIDGDAIDLSHLPSAIYYLKILTGDKEVFSQKLVVR
jgi:hypothetical protein